MRQKSTPSTRTRKKIKNFIITSTQARKHAKHGSTQARLARDLADCVMYRRSRLTVQPIYAGLKCKMVASDWDQTS